MIFSLLQSVGVQSSGSSSGEVTEWASTPHHSISSESGTEVQALNQKAELKGSCLDFVDTDRLSGEIRRRRASFAIGQSSTVTCCDEDDFRLVEHRPLCHHTYIVRISYVTAPT